MTYGVTPQGFNSKRLIEIKNELEDLFISEFGDINLDAQSVTGQLIGIFSKVFADVWENMEDVYFSQYPNSASGVSLDNVVQLNGITRLPARRTTVIGAALGTEGTLIPAGSLARVVNTQNIFQSTINTIISRSNVLQNTVNVIFPVTGDVHTVLINGVAYSYSRPVIGFSGPLIPGNQIQVRINGVNLPTVIYATSSNNTLNLIRNQILLAYPDATVNVSGNSVQIFPGNNSPIIVNSVGIIGGGPTYVPSFTVAGANDVAERLASYVNESTVVNAVWSSGNTFQIQAVQSENPYSIVTSSNLNVSMIYSPVFFEAQSIGPIPVPAGSLTEILTPVAGWTSLTNFQAGVTGRFQETDAELRLRRINSLRVLGAATVEAIRSRLLQEVLGVTSVTIFENVTMTQDPITVTFSTDFIAGTSAQITIDGTNRGTINFSTTHLQMMQDIATQIAAQPEILSAVVGGTGNRNILVEMQDEETIVLTFNLGGAGAPTYTISGGRPPKSFEAVVEGGSDADVALKIWQVKPAGILSFGNTTVVIIDSQGNNQTINFSRASSVYIWVTVALTLNPQETFPANGQALVSQAILAYGNSLGIGVDVFIQRVQAAVFSVSGIASATVQLARTQSVSDIPSYSSSDIDIGETEISVWDLSRINVSV